MDRVLLFMMATVDRSDFAVLQELLQEGSSFEFLLINKGGLQIGALFAGNSRGFLVAMSKVCGSLLGTSVNKANVADLESASSLSQPVSCKSRAQSDGSHGANVKSPIGSDLLFVFLLPADGFSQRTVRSTVRAQFFTVYRSSTMIVRSLLSLIATCLLAVLIAAPANAKTCKKYRMSGLSAWNITSVGARVGARRAWRRKARARYGSRYASWSRANAKSIGCWTVKRRGLRRQRCRAWARPCRR